MVVPSAFHSQPARAFGKIELMSGEYAVAYSHTQWSPLMMVPSGRSSRSTPPYWPISSTGSTTSGLLGSRSVSGGRSPAATMLASIGASLNEVMAPCIPCHSSSWYTSELVSIICAIASDGTSSATATAIGTTRRSKSLLVRIGTFLLVGRTGWIERLRVYAPRMGVPRTDALTTRRTPPVRPASSR